jgi:hypothetical protein
MNARARAATGHTAFVAARASSSGRRQSPNVPYRVSRRRSLSLLAALPDHDPVCDVSIVPAAGARRPLRHASDRPAIDLLPRT